MKSVRAAAFFLFINAAPFHSVGADESSRSVCSYGFMECGSDCSGVDAAVHGGDYTDFCSLAPEFTCLQDCEESGDVSAMTEFAALHCACETNQFFNQNFSEKQATPELLNFSEQLTSP